MKTHKWLKDFILSVIIIISPAKLLENSQLAHRSNRTPTHHFIHSEAKDTLQTVLTGFPKHKNKEMISDNLVLVSWNPKSRLKSTCAQF